MVISCPSTAAAPPNRRCQYPSLRITVSCVPVPAASSADENKELIAAALKLTKEAAGKYEFALEGAEEPAPRLVGEPVLRWSNPSVGEVHGNVFLWTSGGQPAVVGSIFKWFSPHTHMSHEFHSLAEQPLTGKFDGKEVWVCEEPGVRFSALAGAPQPAEGKLQRLLQMRELAAGCAVTKRERDDSASELRLLPTHFKSHLGSRASLCHQGTQRSCCSVFQRRLRPASPRGQPESSGRLT